VPYVVLIETQGNQRYIFATNRLRENAGASELLARPCTSYVIKATKDIAGVDYRLDRPGATVEDQADYFVTVAENNRVASKDIEIVTATSGEALLLVRSREIGRKIVTHVTQRASIDAPGVIVRGFVGTLDTSVDLGAAMKEVRKGAGSLRSALPPPEVRFPTIPIIRPCRSSGLPASSVLGAAQTDERPISLPVLKRDKARKDGVARMKHAIGGELGQSLQSDPERLEKDLAWLGVVHADGNGFGQLFWGLSSRASALGLDYIDTYRRFSVAVNLCGIAAFRTAVTRFPRHGPQSADDPRQIVPLVLGGDDFTVICDGRHAVAFAANYLKAFEEVTANNELVSKIAAADPPVTIGAAAGVAIVKPHFPFYRAYELAEDLNKSAKSHWKPKGSALDFQTIYEDAAPDLDTLRARWIVDGGVATARPYLVTGTAARHRTFEGLKAAAKELRGDAAKGRSGLPRTQQHTLRDALFEGRPIANSRLLQVKHRYDLAWGEVANKDDLFFGDETSLLLDAMEMNDVAAGAAA
jgi:hypothetical protein